MLVYCLHCYVSFGAPTILFSKNPDSDFEAVVKNLCLKIGLTAKVDPNEVADRLAEVSATAPGGNSLRIELLESFDKTSHMCLCYRIDDTMALSITWVGSYDALLEWRPKLPY